MDIQNQAYLVTGAVKDKTDRRDYRIAGITAPIDIPKQRFVVEDEYGSKHQGPRGSCTSQAQAHHKERQEGRRSSARFIMAIVKSMIEHNKKWGAYTRNSFKAVKQYGIPKEELMPEPPFDMPWEEYIDANKIPQAAFDDAKQHKSQSYWRVSKDIDEVRKVLVSNKDKKTTIVISMPWYKNYFNRPKNGVLPIDFDRKSKRSGHAVEIKGFDDFKELLIVKNSWGEYWGDKGDFYMPYPLLKELVWDLWSSIDLPARLAVDDRYGIKRTWSGFMREKAMAFNPWLRRKIGRLPNNREISALAYGFWDYQTVFTGINEDLWLHYSKPTAKAKGLIKVLI